MFLDRDGVINKYPGHGKYVLSEQELEIFPFARDSIKKLKDAGFLIFIVSNQACVSKGLITTQQLLNMTQHMVSYLEKEQKLIDGIYYCIHREEEKCPFRKPAAGLLHKIGQDFKLNCDKTEYFFIGDSIRDVQAASSMQVKSILVLSGRASLDEKDSWKIEPYMICKDLKEAVEVILSTCV